jgi:hypothetical protein
MITVNCKRPVWEKQGTASGTGGGPAAWSIWIVEDRYSNHAASWITAAFGATWNISLLTNFPDGHRRPPHAWPRTLATADKESMNNKRKGSLIATGDDGTAKISEFITQYSRLRRRQLSESSLLQTTSFQEPYS